MIGYGRLYEIRAFYIIVFLEIPNSVIDSCLQLSHVGSTIGSRNLDPESHVRYILRLSFDRNQCESLCSCFPSRILLASP